MANIRRDQEYLGIDTNVLVSYLDTSHPDHSKTVWLADRDVALNPTVIHEAYHTLVFKMKWKEDEASEVLKEASNDEDNLFINQSLKTCMVGLDMAVEHRLGGRDALILANLLTGRISEFITFDESLLRLKIVKHGKRAVRVRRP